MASSPPARSGPLDAYVEQMMPDLYGAFWMRRRVAEEVTAHLREAVERSQARGLSIDQAERKAIDDFGPPHVVARAFAQMKGIGVPTNFTRWSGLALIVGMFTIITAFVWSARSISFEHSVFAPIAFSGLALVGIGLAGVYVRLRGQLGRSARIGVRMFYIGVPLFFISGALWFAPGWVLGMVMGIVGFGLYLVAMTRSNILPKPAVALLWLGIVSSALLGLGGYLFKIHALGGAAAAAQVAFLAGLVWIGLHLWRETADATVSDPPAAVA